MTRRWQSPPLAPELNPAQGFLPGFTLDNPESDSTGVIPTHPILHGKPEDYLETALNEALEANMLAGLNIGYAVNKRTRAKVEQDHGDTTGEYLDEVGFKGRADMHRARAAFGKFVLVSEGVDTNTAPEQVDAATTKLFGIFIGNYVGPANLANRQTLRNFIGAARSARKAGLSGEMIALDAEAVVEPEPKPGDYPKIIEKLRILGRDKRANFLAATRTEATIAVSWLDYLDRPAGINHQLREVARRQHNLKIAELNQDPGLTPETRKALAIQEGVRAVRSIAYEVGDFYSNARDQLPFLEDIREKVATCSNPNALLQEIIGTNHPGYGALVRYIDLFALRGQGSEALQLHFDRVRSTENRKLPQQFEDKNKTIEDPYTARVLRPDPQRRLITAAAQLTVGEVRSAVLGAIADQTRREEFWKTRIYDMAAHMAARPVVKDMLAAYRLPDLRSYQKAS